MGKKDVNKPQAPVRATLRIYEGEEDYLMDILCVDKYKKAINEIMYLINRAYEDAEDDDDMACVLDCLESKAMQFTKGLRLDSVAKK